MEQINDILIFIGKSFLHIWPYLLITIPLAVAVNLSGASHYINKAFSRKPLLSIILATLVGAVSPFCSCGVIPVITSLLIGGVPLGPVMSFWIASPSMDPEMFMLSAATVGWKLSVWRLTATFVISLSAGIITHLAQKKGVFGVSVLRITPVSTTISPVRLQTTSGETTLASCCVAGSDYKPAVTPENECACPAAGQPEQQSMTGKIMNESWKSFAMVAKFMAIAFLINALIKFYLPDDLIKGIIGVDNSWSVLIAALIGIPFYTTNLSALPLVNGLISLGMSQGAALAFLIAGPVTTLPAMMAVWGIVKPRVFMAYLSFCMFGSVIFGYLFNLIG